jgi:hypothetical protein
MKIVDVVFIAYSDLKDTYKPLCFLESFTGDLQETTSKRISMQYWNKVDVPLYRLAEIELPEWMSQEQYLEFLPDISILRKFKLLDCSESQFTKLRMLPDRWKYFIHWIRKKHNTGRNKFMLDILKHVELWLSNERDIRPKPLTENQWNCATRMCDLHFGDLIAARIRQTLPPTTI